MAFELSLEGGLALGKGRGGGQVGSGAHGGSTCQASVDFEVPERAGLGLAGPGRRSWRSELQIRSDRQGGAALGARSNSRLGLWTLPRRQWGASGVSEQGRAAPVSPIVFPPGGAEPCNVSARPLDGDILANLNHGAAADTAARETDPGTARSSRARLLAADATGNAGIVKPKSN